MLTTCLSVLPAVLANHPSTYDKSNNYFTLTTYQNLANLDNIPVFCPFRRVSNKNQQGESWHQSLWESSKHGSLASTGNDGQYTWICLNFVLQALNGSASTRIRQIHVQPSFTWKKTDCNANSLY